MWINTDRHEEGLLRRIISSHTLTVLTLSWAVTNSTPAARCLSSGSWVQILLEPWLLIRVLLCHINSDIDLPMAWLFTHWEDWCSSNTLFEYCQESKLPYCMLRLSGTVLVSYSRRRVSYLRVFVTSLVPPANVLLSFDVMNLGSWKIVVKLIRT
jgi:hypothetical protein